MGVLACGCVFRGGMSDTMGSKRCFQLTFSTGSASRKVQSNTAVEALFRPCKKTRFGLESKRAGFRLKNPTVY